VRRIVVRTLSRELSLYTEGDSAFAALSYVGADPVMPARALLPVDMTVERVGMFFRIKPNDNEAIEGSIETVVNGVFRQLATWFAEEAENSPVLHAAMAVIEGRRFVFLGDKGYGKTTLMLKLIERGIVVAGDENVVLTQDGAITRPRRLHVKESSLALVPALHDAILSSPSTTDWMGNRVFACAPSIGGDRWEIAEGPIDHLVFVEPNFGGSSILSPLSRDNAFARLLETIFMPPAMRGPAVVRLRRLCVDARLWRLQAGDLDQAVLHLKAAAVFGRRDSS